MKSIRSWTKDIHANAVDHGWWETDERNAGEVIANIHAEVSEAWECYRDGQIDTMVHDNGKPEGMWVELADVVIRVLDLCGRFEIDLEHVMALKHEYNKSRPYRHGGKQA